MLTFTSVTVKGVDEMKKLSIILALIMLIGLFASCEGIGDGGLSVDSYAPEFELSFEPMPKREYVRGERLTVIACVENISGKDLTYTAIDGSYYPTIEIYSQADGSSVNTSLRHEPIVTSSGGSVEFTAKAGQIGSQTYTFIIPKDAAPGSYSITLNYRGDVCTYNDVFVISDRLSHIYSMSLVSSGSYAINPISVKIGDTFYKNEESIWTEEIAGWQYILNNSMYKVDEFPTLVLDGELEVQMPENVSFSLLQIFGTDFDYDSYKFNLNSFSDVGSLEKGEYVIVAFANEKIAAAAPHSIVGEYDYKLTKSALVFKLVVR